MEPREGFCTGLRDWSVRPRNPDAFPAGHPRWVEGAVQLGNGRKLTDPAVQPRGLERRIWGMKRRPRRQAERPLCDEKADRRCDPTQWARRAVSGPRDREAATESPPPVGIEIPARRQRFQPVWTVLSFWPQRSHRQVRAPARPRRATIPVAAAALPAIPRSAPRAARSARLPRALPRRRRPGR
jgi:hypothetical protein